MHQPTLHESYCRSVWTGRYAHYDDERMRKDCNHEPMEGLPLQTFHTDAFSIKLVWTVLIESLPYSNYQNCFPDRQWDCFNMFRDRSSTYPMRKRFLFAFVVWHIARQFGIRRFLRLLTLRKRALQNGSMLLHTQHDLKAILTTKTLLFISFTQFYSLRVRNI